MNKRNNRLGWEERRSGLRSVKIIREYSQAA